MHVKLQHAGSQPLCLTEGCVSHTICVHWWNIRNLPYLVERPWKALCKRSWVKVMWFNPSSAQTCLSASSCALIKHTSAASGKHFKFKFHLFPPCLKLRALTPEKAIPSRTETENDGGGNVVEAKHSNGISPWLTETFLWGHSDWFEDG